MTEEFENRAAPLTPYAWPGETLTVPSTAVDATLTMLRRFGARESCTFWYGQRQREGSVVCAVFAPKQHMEQRWYAVEPQAVSQMANLAADNGWRPLAQIHSHPGRWVEHSIYDDQMAASRRALSLVFPNFGNWRDKWPDGVGVHEYQNGYWHRLSRLDAARRVVISESSAIVVRDFR